MTTHFRTLLLLGFTAAAASSGCIIETTSNGGDTSSCAQNRYFQLQWLMDNGVGTARLPCAAAPATSVELILASRTSYVVDGACDEGYQYNWAGYTQSGISKGDHVTSYRLLRSDTRAEISPGGVLPGASAHNPAMPACGHVQLTYEFPLM